MNFLQTLLGWYEYLTLEQLEIATKFVALVSAVGVGVWKIMSIFKLPKKAGSQQITPQMHGSKSIQVGNIYANGKANVHVGDSVATRHVQK